jgi:hypothetical protein
MTLTVSPAGAFHDPEIKPLLDQYRQLVAQRYTPCALSDLSRLIAAPPFHVSRKIDGELWFLVVGTDEAVLVAANGRVASGTHDIHTIGKTLGAGTILAGELYLPKADGRERVGDVRTAISDGGLDLSLAVFDVVQYQEMSWRDTPYGERLEIMREVIPTSGPLAMIPVVTTESELDVMGLFQDLVENAGGEGLIIRCSDGRALKVKPERTLDCAVLGFTSRISRTSQEEVRSLLLGLAGDETESLVVVGTVGNFIEGVDRRSLLETLTPLVRPSQFRRAASSGQLYYMVEPQHIVECRVLDVQAEDAKGRKIRQPMLRITDGEWHVIGTQIAATLINPIVLRLRDDKADVEQGARWDQIADSVSIAQGSQGPVSASEIVERRVWTKESKGKKDVRKLLIWKTNKDSEDSLYPAYVVHWTDYSSGRKSPLAREVRPLPTLEDARSVAEEMVASNIKKGWIEHEAT